MIKDTYIMPFGKHKGKMIGNIPAEYLLWLREELLIKCSPFAQPILEYLNDNLEALEYEKSVNQNKMPRQWNP